MLREGPYPLYLQQRVKSKHGHLANDDAGQFVRKMAAGGLRHVVLAHLSETNNMPELAFQCTCRCLEGHGEQVRIIVASQNIPSPFLDLSGVSD